MTQPSTDELFLQAHALHKAGKLDEAEPLYAKVMQADPHHENGLHFWGLLRHQRGDNDWAIELMQRAIAIDPHYTEVYNNLGNVYKILGQNGQAEAQYRRVLELDPRHVLAWNNLGVALAHQQRLEEAAACYHQALELHPRYNEACHNLANILMHLKQTDDAIAHFRRSIEMSPLESKSYASLGSALLSQNRKAEALEVYRTWLKRAPHNRMAQHLYAACSGENMPDRASNEYVTELFDQFAGSFEERLQMLQYKGPQVVAAAVERALGPAGEKPCDILDAGCGTGLCAPLLKSRARRLAGVDLSQQMLARAAGRKMYDQLLKGELTEYLQGLSREFDLIVSADTLVYFGNLSDVLSAASQALRPGGRLIFTLEAAEEPSGYHLREHGRYQHSEAYVRNALQESGLELTELSSDSTRYELGEPVPCWVVAARSQVK